MNEFEDRLRLELRSDPALPDEVFVAKVEEAIVRSGRRRAIGLGLAGLVMAGLGSAWAAGLAALAPVWTALADKAPTLFPDPILGLMSPVGAIALGLIVMALLVAPIARSGR